MPSPTDAIRRLRQSVERLRFRQRLLDFSVRVVGILVLVLVSALLAATADFCWATPESRLAQLALLVWSLSAALLLSALVVSLRDPRHSLLRAARRMEKSASPAPDELLISALTLTDADVVRYGFSPSLVATVRRQALERYETIPLRGMLECQALWRNLRLLTVVLCLFLPFLVLPQPRESVWRVLRAWSFDSLGPRPARLLVEPGAATLVYGEALNIRVRGSQMPRMELELLSQGQRERWELNRDPPGFSGRIEGKVTDFRYRVLSWRERSAWYPVRVLRYPYVSFWRTEYTHPPHTGLPPAVDEDRRLLAGPRGTVACIHIRASKALKSAELVCGTRSVQLTLQGELEAGGTLRLMESGEFYLRLTDRQGLTAGQEEKGRIEVRNDDPPRVSILRPPPLQEWTRADTVELSWQAEDDFGLRGVRLHLADDEATRAVELVQVAEGTRRLDGRALLPLPPGLIEKGGQLRYAVEAWDNDGVDGSKSGFSPWHLLIVPPPADTLEAFEQSLETAEARLRRLHEEETRLMVDERRLLQQLEKARIPDAAERKEAEFIVYRQQKIMAEAREIARELQERMESVRDNPYIRSGMLEKFRRMQNLLQELATPELSELMNRLQNQMENLQFDKQEFQRFAQAFDPEKLAEKFDRMVQLLERMKDEQQREALTRRIQELERRQRSLQAEVERLRALEGIDAEARAAALAQFARQEQDLAADTLDLQRRLAELGESVGRYAPEAREDLEVAERELQSSLDEQGAAAQAWQENMADRGVERAMNAAKYLRQAGEALKRAGQQLSSSRAAEQKQRLQQAARLVFRALEALPVLAARLNDSRSLGRSRLPKLRDRHLRDSASLGSRMSRNLVSVQQLLREASRQSFSIGPELLIPVDEIHLQLRQIEAALTEGQEERAAAFFPTLSAGLTRLTAVLLALAEQAEREGNMSLMQQYMESLQEMARRQQSLNQAMKQMGMEGALNEGMLRQMAMEQEMLRQGMESLAGQFDQRSAMHRRLMELRDEMEDLQAEYLRRNVGERIQARQQQLHQRMLETVRAMKQEGEEEERRAEKAKTYLPQAREIPRETEREQRIRDALRSMEREVYPREYESLIRHYFERIGR